MHISVVIPTLNNPKDVQRVLASLNNQQQLPNEIVIIDSSENDEIDYLVQKSISSIPITYKRYGRAYRLDRLYYFLSKIFFIKKFFVNLPKGRAYPYEASNHGSLIAKHEWIAFLDATTLPNDQWIQDYCRILQNKEAEAIFGKTKYLATTYFQSILRACTYGRNGIETAPGSFMKKADFLNGFQITEGVRSGGDVDWKNRVRNNFVTLTPEKSYLVYPHLHKNLLSCIKKFFIYQMHTAVQDIAHSIKDAYFILALLFTLVLIPKWNAIVGWESSPYFLPHITKIYFISITLILLISILFNRFMSPDADKPLLKNAYKIIFLILISFGVYNWNNYLAGWVEESIWFIPHITKIFISLVCLASFIYRGLYFPIKNNIKLSFLFPFNWFVAGSLGLLLDIVKAPGYLLGALISPFIKVIRSPG
jgi:glycosyltransferase involved in cell wall biosynthesis